MVAALQPSACISHVVDPSGWVGAHQGKSIPHRKACLESLLSTHANYRLSFSPVPF